MIIPALDLSGGRVVRLKQGDFDKKTVFDVDPIQRIRIAANQGAELIHIVDLDGAKDPVKRQRAKIKQIVDSSPLPIQTGGGIRSQFDIKNLLDLGVERVVVGSVAVKNPELVRGWFNYFGSDRITLALDVRLIDNVPYVATHGWLKTSNTTLDQVLKHFIPYHIEHILVTDISRDGMMSGANNSLYATLAEKYKDIDIIASGGISSLEDIKAVARARATSVVLGRSLLENKFTVEEAVLCWQNA